MKIIFQRAGQRARSLVQQILTFSRNEPPQRSAVNLTEVVHETERLLRVTMPPAIDLHMHLSSRLPALRAWADASGNHLLTIAAESAGYAGDAQPRYD